MFSSSSHQSDQTSLIKYRSGPKTTTLPKSVSCSCLHNRLRLRKTLRSLKLKYSATSYGLVVGCSLSFF